MSLAVRIRHVQEAGSRTEKIRLLKQYMDEEPLVKSVVVYGMDPMKVFNVGKRSVKLTGEHGTQLLGASDFEFLDSLNARRMNRTAGASWASARVKQLREDEAKLLISILDKDLSWGLGASTINDAFPGMLTEFNCMLAAPFEKAKFKFPVRIEPKFDGMRVLALIDGNEGPVQFFSRTGKPVDSLPQSLIDGCVALAKGLDTLGGIVLDGEVMGDSFKETMEKARRKSETFEDAKFYVFDWLPMSEFKKIGRIASERVYRDRRSLLEKAYSRTSKNAGPVIIPQSYLASSEEEIMSFYNAFRDGGLEGAIVKSLDGAYVGKRSPNWIKIKAEETEDLEIIGYEEGEGKFTGTLGALIVDRNGVAVRVGTGLTDDDRNSIWANKTLYLHKLIEVQYQEVTPDGSLRHPRFIRMRMDKSEW